MGVCFWLDCSDCFVGVFGSVFCFSELGYYELRLQLGDRRRVCPRMSTAKRMEEEVNEMKLRDVKQ